VLIRGAFIYIPALALAHEHVSGGAAALVGTQCVVAVVAAAALAIRALVNVLTSIVIDELEPTLA
jgi:hypothetical protein